MQCDLAGKEGICQDRRQMDKFCEENGFIGWFETSAKDDMGIEDAAKHLVAKILEDSPQGPPKKGGKGTVDLAGKKKEGGNQQPPESTGCC